MSTRQRLICERLSQKIQQNIITRFQVGVKHFVTHPRSLYSTSLIQPSHFHADLNWYLPSRPFWESTQRVKSFLGYSAVPMRKGRVFQKESTLSGNSSANEEVDPTILLHNQCRMVEIYHSIHSRQYKGNREPQFSLWKSRQPPPTCPGKGVENSVYLPPILQNCVYEYC